MIVAADSILFLTCVKSQGGEVHKGGSNQSQSWQVLLEAFELGMHHVELEQLGALEDVIQVLLGEWNDDLMVPASPVRIAARVDDVRRKVLVLTDDVFEHLRNAEPDVGIGWLMLIDWVQEAHRRNNIDGEGQLLNNRFFLSGLAHLLRQKTLTAVHLHLNNLENLANQYDEVQLALEAVSRAVDIQALEWLLASLDEVIDNLSLDLELVLEH